VFLLLARFLLVYYWLAFDVHWRERIELDGEEKAQSRITNNKAVLTRPAPAMPDRGFLFARGTCLGSSCIGRKRT